MRFKRGDVVRIKTEDICSDLRVSHGWGRDRRVTGNVVEQQRHRVGVDINGETLWFNDEVIELFNAQMSFELSERN